MGSMLHSSSIVVLWCNNRTCACPRSHPLHFAFPPKSHQMSTKNCPQLKVLLLGDHNAGKTRYLITLMANRLLSENTYTLRIADSFTLTLANPGASPLEDPSAWRGWCDSYERKARDKRKPEGQHTLSTKQVYTIAPCEYSIVIAP